MNEIVHVVWQTVDSIVLDVIYRTLDGLWKAFVVGVACVENAVFRATLDARPCALSTYSIACILSTSKCPFYGLFRALEAAILFDHPHAFHVHFWRGLAFFIFVGMMLSLIYEILRVIKTFIRAAARIISGPKHVYVKTPAFIRTQFRSTRSGRRRSILVRQNV